MKTSLSTILILMISFPSFGNDGVYLTKGGVIYPTQETKISLEKERLSFTVRDQIAYVEIQFEFNNPENTDRKLLVGFQAPTAAGDVPDALSNTNQIKNFTIIQNGTILPYSLKAADCDSCELKDPKELHFSQFNTGLFVFLFEITFKPGMNRINHSYSFPASNNVVFDQFYNYILTTGSKWAGERIKDLTVNIDMGQNKYFYVHDIFGRAADWSIIGTGKVTDEKFDYVDADTCRMVRTLSGYLQINVTDFQPIKNIEFGIVSNHSFNVWPVHNEKIRDGEIASIGDLSLLCLPKRGRRSFPFSPIREVTLMSIHDVPPRRARPFYPLVSGFRYTAREIWPARLGIFWEKEQYLRPKKSSLNKGKGISKEDGWYVSWR